MQCLLVCVLGAALAGCTRAGFDPRGAPDRDLDARSRDLAPNDASPGDAPTDAAPRGDSDAAATSTRLRFAILVQGQTASFLEQLDLDPSAPAATSARKLASALRLDGIGDSSARSLTLWRDTLLVGSGAVARGEVIGLNPLRSLGSLSFDSSAASVAEDRVENLHGLCTVAGGIIAGEFGGWTAGNAVGLFREVGASTFRLANPLYRTTTSEGGSLASCAGTATDLYLTDYGASDDTAGTVVHLSGTGQDFALAHRFDPVAFAGAVTTPIYSIVLHTNGFLYLFPQRRYGSQLRRLVRCPTPDLSATNCVALGLLPSDPGGGGDVPAGLQGAAQLPGHQDLLFTTNSHLYRYSLQQDTVSQLLDLTRTFDDLITSTGARDTIQSLRHLVFLPEPAAR